MNERPPPTRLFGPPTNGLSAWPEFSRSLALVIGINEYANGIPSLTTAANDARRLAALLAQDYGYAVHLVTDTASKACLTSLFCEQLPAEVGENDRLLVYFAGHGIALDGEDGPAGYLIPQDARPEDRTTFLAMNEIHNALIGLPCRHLLTILDCCFAGAFRWASTRLFQATLPDVLHRERYDRYVRDPAWQVITSAAFDQTALDLLSPTRVGGRSAVAGEDGLHSPFALALFAALRGAGDLIPKGVGDGVITASELYLYLRDAVEVEAEEQANHLQTPGLWPLRRHGKGEYIFLVPGHPLNLPPAPPLTAENNPYRGLQPYNEADADLLFGRGVLSDGLAGQVATQPLTVVLGASGTGKSSLVKAGLLPRLRAIAQPGGASVGVVDQSLAQAGTTSQTDSAPLWRILPPIRPGDAPLRLLADLVLRELSGALPGQHLRYPSPEQVTAPLEAWLIAQPAQRLVLVVDQFEELITLCRDEQERGQFLATLAELVAHPSARLHVVLTLRTDFEPQFAASPLADRWPTSRFVVPPMTQAELREVIEQPAARRVLFFDPPTLVDSLIDEVIQTPGALPLLSFTLSELYLKYLKRQEEAQRVGDASERSLTAADYRALGGVIGSLRTRADEVFTALDEAEQATMPRIMLRMVAVEGGELARRRVPLAELIYEDSAETVRVQRVIDRLVEARLLVRGSADLDDDTLLDAYVEPAHDALVRAWDKLIVWKQQADDYLPLQRRLARAATEWQRAGAEQQSGLLWNNDPGLLQVLPALLRQSGALGALLNLVRSLWPAGEIKEKPTWLNRLESAFIAASLRQRRAIRRRAVLITLGVFASLLALTIFAFLQRNAAQRQAEVSHSTALAANAQQAIQNKDFDLAIALALEATGITDPPETAVNTLAAAAYVPGAQVVFNGHTADVTGVAFSPDGRTILSGSLDKSAILWDAATGEIIHKLGDDEITRVTSVAYSPLGDMAVLGQDDGQIVVWEVASGTILRRLSGLTGPVTALTISPDGQQVLAGDQRGALALWDVGGSEPIRQFAGHARGVRAVALSADGSRALSGGRDNLLILWNLANGEAVQRFEGHQGAVILVAFGPFPRNVLSGSPDGNVVIWNIASGRPVQGFLLRQHTQTIGSIAVAPDNSTVVSGALDGSMILWDKPPLGGLVRTFVGHRAPIISLAYSRDGRHVLSGSKEGVVRLWDIGGPTQVRRVTIEPALVDSEPIDPIHNLAIGEEHGRAFSGAAGALILWDLATGKEIQRFPAPTNRLSAVALSADGRRALSGVAGHLTLWDLETGKALRRLFGNTDDMVTMRFSPDGATAWAADRAGLVLRWPLDSVQRPTKTKLTVPGLWSIALSADGSFALTGSEDRSVILWNLDTGQEVRRFPGHHDAVYWVALSPDEKTAASASADRQVMLWDLASGQAIRTFQGHTLPVHTVAYSPDGRTLLSGGEDNTVRLWDIATGAETFRFEGHAITVQNILYLRNQPRLLSRGVDGTLILWQFPPADEGLEQLDLAFLQTWTHANRYVRDLTCDERALYEVTPLCPGAATPQ